MKHFLYILCICCLVTTSINAQTSTPLLTLPEGNRIGDGTFIGVASYNSQPCGVKSFALEHHFYGVVNSSINFFRGSSVSGGFLTFNTNDNSERLRIDPNGNIGIGTQNPAYKLDVFGTIRAKEVLVNLDGGADFVFDKNYKLPPLNRIAAYVKKNQHLPDIPSAGEMVKNGISRGC